MMKCCSTIPFIHDINRAIAARTYAELTECVYAKREVLTVYLQQTRQISANARDWQRAVQYATT